MKILRELGTAIFEERDALLIQWRDQVRTLPSAAKLDMPTLNDHIPGWLAELAACLVTASEAPEGGNANVTPLAHGLQRFEDGFDIEEVVGEYNMLRNCFRDLVERRGMVITGEARRFLDKFFDDAIATAVKAFAETQAREVQRRRTEYLAFVTHDLRTPLSVITFSAYLLEQRLVGKSLDAENSRLLKVLARNTRQLETLVGSVLAENTQMLTELGVVMERRKLDLWPMVETLIQDLQPIAMKSGAKVINEVPDDLEAVADANLLRRVLQNLLVNAIAYSPGGEVMVGASDPGGGQPLEVWVKDNGAGIPAERLAKVFDVLETDPEGDGVGLGLAIVKTFVEAHDGAVWVESVEGKGATFRFTLPRSAKVHATEPAAAQPA
jgi:signal transduction histidine kinase